MSNYARCCSCGEDADTDAVICGKCEQKFDTAQRERESAKDQRIAQLEATLANCAAGPWHKWPGEEKPPLTECLVQVQWRNEIHFHLSWWASSLDEWHRGGVIAWAEIQLPKERL